jgi:hypothetical protein
LVDAVADDTVRRPGIPHRMRWSIEWEIEYATN